MISSTAVQILKTERVQHLPRLLLAPVPLFPLQPLLRRMLAAAVAAHPGLFDRLGPHRKQHFLIDPVNLPFVLVLKPDPEDLYIRAVRRHSQPPCDARIAGTLLTLLDMIDGRLDGDALFFSRDLIVEGDTEAVVCLRNALDDLEGSVADDIAGVLGPPGRMMLSALRQLGAVHDR